MHWKTYFRLEDKAEKATYEQAVFCHWAHRLFRQYGTAWRKEGDKIVKRLVEGDTT